MTNTQNNNTLYCRWSRMKPQNGLYPWQESSSNQPNQLQWGCSSVVHVCRCNDQVPQGWLQSILYGATEARMKWLKDTNCLSHFWLASVSPYNCPGFPRLKSNLTLAVSISSSSISWAIVWGNRGKHEVAQMFQSQPQGTWLSHQETCHFSPNECPLTLPTPRQHNSQDSTHSHWIQ